MSEQHIGSSQELKGAWEHNLHASNRHDSQWILIDATGFKLQRLFDSLSTILTISFNHCFWRTKVKLSDSGFFLVNILRLFSSSMTVVMAPPLLNRTLTEYLWVVDKPRCLSDICRYFDILWAKTLIIYLRNALTMVIVVSWSHKTRVRYETSCEKMWCNKFSYQTLEWCCN